MIEINLLPKEYRKKSLNFSLGKAGAISIAAALGVVVMLIAVTFYQRHQIDVLDSNIAKAHQRAAMLKKDIKIVDALLDIKGKISNRMTGVNRLDSHRSAWVNILQDFAGNIPEYVWLSKFEETIPEETKKAGKSSANMGSNDKGKAEQKKNRQDSSIPLVRPVSIEGYAFTLNGLATFMINMMRSDYFEDVELVSSMEKFLDNENKHRAHNFVVSCNLHYLSDEQLRKVVAQVNTNKKKGNSRTSHQALN